MEPDSHNDTIICHRSLRNQAACGMADNAAHQYWLTVSCWYLTSLWQWRHQNSSLLQQCSGNEGYSPLSNVMHILLNAVTNTNGIPYRRSPTLCLTNCSLMHPFRAIWVSHKPMAKTTQFQTTQFSRNGTMGPSGGLTFKIQACIACITSTFRKRKYSTTLSLSINTDQHRVMNRTRRLHTTFRAGGMVSNCAR